MYYPQQPLLSFCDQVAALTSLSSRRGGRSLPWQEQAVLVAVGILPFAHARLPGPQQRGSGLVVHLRVPHAERLQRLVGLQRTGDMQGQAGPQLVVADAQLQQRGVDRQAPRQHLPLLVPQTVAVDHQLAQRVRRLGAEEVRQRPAAGGAQHAVGQDEADKL
ncbi:unnamed protein product [Heterosigma akashiwo]